MGFRACHSVVDSFTNPIPADEKNRHLPAVATLHVTSGLAVVSFGSLTFAMPFSFCRRTDVAAVVLTVVATISSRAVFTVDDARPEMVLSYEVPDALPPASQTTVAVEVPTTLNFAEN